jgi:hypothetical protein
MIQAKTYRTKNTVEAFVFDGSDEAAWWLDDLDNCENYYIDGDTNISSASVSDTVDLPIEKGNVIVMSGKTITWVYPNMETFLHDYEPTKQPEE